MQLDRARHALIATMQTAVHAKLIAETLRIATSLAVARLLVLDRRRPTHTRTWDVSRQRPTTSLVRILRREAKRGKRARKSAAQAS